MPFPWFRFYHEWIGDVKVQTMPFHWQRHLVAIFCWHASGDLERLPDAVLAEAFRMTPGELAEMKATFRERGFIADQGWTPRNWEKRQRASDNAGTRAKTYRDRKRDSREQSNTPSRDDNVTLRDASHFPSNSSPDLIKNFDLESEKLSQVKNKTSSRNRHVTQCDASESNGECPAYPDPDTGFVTVHTGPHEMPDEVAQDIWRRIFARWHDKTLCAEWYQHQRWYTAEVWTAAFTRVEKKYPNQKVGIRLVETIAAEFAANGQPEEKPPAAPPARPKSRAQELREATAAKLAELKAKPGYQTMQEMIEEEKHEEANKESGKQ